MNKKRIKMYWEMELPKELQKKIVRIVAIVFVVEVVVMLLASLWFRLEFAWSEMSFQNHYQGEALQEMMNGLKRTVWSQFAAIRMIPQMTFLFGTVFAWILPFYGIYRHYYDSNSIYTLMRLPGSKKEFYFGKLIPAVGLPVALYIICSILYAVPYLLYKILMPNEYELNKGFDLLEGSFFPCSIANIDENIINVLIVCIILVYIPSLFIMGIFAERSRKRPLATIIGIGLMIGSLWISTPFWGSVMTMDTIGVLEFLLGVLACAICIVGSVYYMERVQLV